ncbi:ABC transporter substrate-binding protein [Rhodoferax sp.]|uniref:MlaC/ttg2D family ABC transporter substrate-binding protein n=1 Tax=Rhodoferax sp. TaxID=50421 RepID=UPI002849C259|nr:ABC transporter substrate-binding protein [Rhodoferax sp.]MDR3370006.1 ABC transporter substrate-binding protein [Rhodoferax sp.]
MKRRFLLHGLPLLGAAALGLRLNAAWAAEEAPDALIGRLTQEALDIIQADKAVQAGDVGRIMEVMDQKIMPFLDFQRMTSSAVGPGWRQATPEQRTRLQAEFKTLLVRTYSGAMSQAKNLTFSLKPMRSSPEDKDVIVRTLIKGRGDPVQLDYRLEKTPGEGAGWKIYNLNVLGVWLVDTYRSQFSQEINAKGIDGLIATLSERNKANAVGDTKSAKG